MDLLEREVKNGEEGEEERREEQMKQEEKATQESQPNQYLNLSLAR
jgi:jasmonate ZIM domain-containing protein